MSQQNTEGELVFAPDATHSQLVCDEQLFRARDKRMLSKAVADLELRGQRLVVLSNAGIASASESEFSIFSRALNLWLFHLLVLRRVLVEYGYAVPGEFPGYDASSASQLNYVNEWLCALPKIAGHLRREVAAGDPPPEQERHLNG